MPRGVRPAKNRQVSKDVPRKLLIVEEGDHWVIMLEWKGRQTRSYQVPPEVGSRAMERAQDGVIEVVAAWGLSTGRISDLGTKGGM